MLNNDKIFSKKKCVVIDWKLNWTQQQYLIYNEHCTSIKIIQKNKSCISIQNGICWIMTQKFQGDQKVQHMSFNGVRLVEWNISGNAM